MSLAWDYATPARTRRLARRQPLRWRAAWLTIHAILIALTATLGAWRDQR